jgi:hypothetical protein
MNLYIYTTIFPFDYIGSYSPIEALANYMVSTTKIMEETEGM